MKPLLIFAIAAPLLGQEAAASKDAAPSPVPSTETWLSGSIDLGYRWRTGVAGSFESYRSIVNLGSGVGHGAGIALVVEARRDARKQQRLGQRPARRTHAVARGRGVKTGS